MNVLTTKGWEDYALLDSGGGKRLERFGSYVLVRPDPQCIWSPTLPAADWEKADAVFEKKSDGKEGWIRKSAVPERWLMKYKDLSFYAKLSPFKHTGVFPEQHLMWDWMSSVILPARLSGGSANEGSHKIDSSLSVQNDEKEIAALPSIARHENNTKELGTKHQINVLNLFGYTGIASLAAAVAGAKVTHVDASHPTIGWARENQEASGLTDKPIRWIPDDCVKFVAREVKRGVRYDGIIMDPPIFGHGPDGERWEFFDSFPHLLTLCKQVLTEKPLFIIINAYAISASSIMLENILQDTMRELGGEIESGELALEEESGRLLSTGIFARWVATQ